ncbi:tetratricopeptide repeat protein [uncultured Microscilla sp.]|uniref:tetratricopeptide repeat protein n=1 Tax=uncultured Microscilla sp. TaxID=432653 RepID=UPI0026174D4A|nr:tetratricopeptide repeat protein [uncultured Microscilla sp.]
MLHKIEHCLMFTVQVQTHKHKKLIKMREILVISILVLLVANASVQAQSIPLDSLQKEYLSLKVDTQKARFLLKVASAYETRKQHYKADSLLGEMLEIAHNKQLPKYEILALLKKGRFWQERSNYKKSLKYYHQALDKMKATSYPLIKARAFQLLGSLFAEQGKLEESETYYQKSLDIYDSTQNLKGIAQSYISLGRMFKGRRQFDKALQYYDKAIKAFKQQNDPMTIALIYRRKGVIYRMLKKYKQSEAFYKKALKIYKAQKSERGIASTLYNLGLLYAYQKKYPKAIEFSLQSLKLKQKVGTQRQIANSFTNLGELFVLSGNLNRADTMLKNALSITKKQGMNDLVMYNYQSLALLDSARGNMIGAWNYLRKYQKVNAKLYDQRGKKLLTKMRAKYDTERKENENELLKQEKAMQLQKLKTQYLWLIIISGGFFAMVLLAVVLYRYYRSKQKANLHLSKLNQELHQQQEEIISQRDFIENQNKSLSEKNTMITQSIKAAKNIQDATLPFTSRVDAFLQEYFCIYRPKDIVSGDFYWIEKIDEHIFIVAVDCTGHGVPGAFMSMITNTLLDHIVKVQRIMQPQEILSELNVKFGYALKKQESNTNSGMDVGMCRLSSTDNTQVTNVAFSGARRPLYYITPKSNELIEVRGTRRSIGSKRREDLEFEGHQLPLPQGSMLYLSSDGYADQNDEKRRKIGTACLKQLLFDISPWPVARQKKVLLDHLKNHMKNTEQRDDVLLLGVRL